MPPRLRATFAVMILGLFLIPAIALYRELSKRSDIWWTPPSLMVPVAEAADRVRVYIDGKPLTALVGAGQLRIADGPSSNVVATSDIGFRINNYDRVRAERIPLLLAYAAMCGALTALTLVLLSGRLAYRGEVASSS
jgi:hypothetical protein